MEQTLSCNANSRAEVKTFLLLRNSKICYSGDKR